MLKKQNSLSGNFIKHFTNLFLPNPSPEADEPVQETSKLQSPEGKTPTTATYDDGKRKKQHSIHPANMFAVFAKGTVDQEKAPVQTKITADDNITLFPSGSLDTLHPAEDRYDQQIGNFFTWTPKFKTDQPQSPSRAEKPSNSDMIVENHPGIYSSKRDNYQETQSFSSYISEDHDIDVRECSRETLEANDTETPVTEKTFGNGQIQLDERALMSMEAIGLKKKSSTEYKANGRSQQELHDSACNTDSTTNGLQLDRDVTFTHAEMFAANAKSLADPPRLDQKHQEYNNHNSEKTTEPNAEIDNSQINQDLSLPPTITYSTYRGGRPFTKKAIYAAKKQYKPFNDTIAEGNEYTTTPCTYIASPTQVSVSERLIGLENAEDLDLPGDTAVSITDTEAALGQLLTVSSENPHKQLSQVDVLQPEVSGNIVIPLINDSVFYRYYKESVENLLSSLKDNTSQLDDVEVDEKMQSINNASNIEAAERDVNENFSQPNKEQSSALNNNDILYLTEQNFTSPFKKGSKLSPPECGNQRYLDEEKENIYTVIDRNVCDHDKQNLDQQTTIWTDEIVATKPREIKSKVSENEIPAQQCSFIEVGQGTDLPEPYHLIRNPNGSDNMEEWTERKEQVDRKIGQNMVERILLNSMSDLAEFNSTESVKPNDLISYQPFISATIPTETFGKYDHVELDASSRIQTSKRTSMSAGEHEQRLADFQSFSDAEEEMIGDHDGTSDTSHTVTKQSANEELLETITSDESKEATSANQVVITVPMNEINEQVKSTADNPNSLKSSETKVIEANGSTIIETKSDSVPIVRVCYTFEKFGNGNGSSGVSLSKLPINCKGKVSARRLTIPSLTSNLGRETEKTLREFRETVSKIKSLPVTSIYEELMQMQTRDTSPMLTKTEETIEESLGKASTNSVEFTHKSTIGLENTKDLDLPGDTNITHIQLRQANALQPKASKKDEHSLVNESMFYRYYKESVSNSLSNLKDNASHLEETQTVEKMQSIRKVFKIATAERNVSEKPSQISKKQNSAVNSMWYKSFQQGAFFPNVKENVPSSRLVQIKLSKKTEKYENAKSALPVVKASKETIGSTFQESTFKSYRMIHLKEQTKEIRKEINDNIVPWTKLPTDDTEVTLKILEKEMVPIILHSDPLSVATIPEVDATQLAIKTKESDSTFTGKPNETAEEIISSTEPIIPHAQESGKLIKGDITAAETGLDSTKLAMVGDDAEAIDSDESTDNVKIAVFEENIKVSEEENNFAQSFKQFVADVPSWQVDDTSESTENEENGVDVISEAQSSSNLADLECAKSINEIAKGIGQEHLQFTQEFFANIQAADRTVQLQPSQRLQCNYHTEAPAITEFKCFTEPHTQPSAIANKGDAITVETSSDVTKVVRVGNGTGNTNSDESINNIAIGKSEKNISNSEERKFTNRKITVKRSNWPVDQMGDLFEGTEGTTEGLEMGSNTTAEALPSASQGIGNDSHVNTKDTPKLVYLDTEMNNTINTTESLSSEISSEIVNREYQSGAPSNEENTTQVNQKYSIFDPAQSSDQLCADSVKLIQPNKCHDLSILDLGKSITSSEDHFTTSSDELTRAMHLDDADDSTEDEDEEMDNFSEVSSNIHLSSVGEDTELTEQEDNEDETEMWLLEEAKLVQCNSPSWIFGRSMIYPLSLSPIYEELLPYEETVDSCNEYHPASDPTQQKTIASVSPVLESATTSLQPERSAQQFEEQEESPISLVPVLEGSTASSSNNLTEESLHEEQTITSCVYIAPFIPGSVSEHIEEHIEEPNNEPERKDVILSTVKEEGLQTQLQRKSKATISTKVSESILYKYFQSFPLQKIKQVTDKTDSSCRTNQKPDPPNDPSVSKSHVKDTHLKINPRPGKMIIYDQLQFHGNKHEIMTDVPDATSWIFLNGISLKIVRGCWILYEKPEFQGQAYILEEGEKELHQLWLHNDILAMESSSPQIVIGSIKRGTKNHSISEVEIQESCQDNIPMFLQREVACVEEFGIATSMSNIIVNSGIWLAYKKPNFSGQFTVLEPDSNPGIMSTELESDYVKSLRPLKMGSLKVENPLSPKVVIFEKPFFSGNFREVSKDILMSKTLWKEDGEMNNEDFRGFGSIRVIGGVWVAYEKECFRGNQYFLEEGEYEDWHAWGGFNSEVQSLRYIQVDFMQPVITLFEQPDLKDGNKTIVNHDIPDLESIAYGTVTQSIEVKNGMWVAYQGSHYSGEQYILEKGVYRRHTDWGGRDGTIMSIRPIQLEPIGYDKPKFQLQAYSEADFQGTCIEIVTEVSNLSTFQLKSFKVVRGCWVLYDDEDFDGCQYVLEEGYYPDLGSWGCLTMETIQSLKPIIPDFCEPSISLFTQDSYQGRELIVTEAISLLQSNKYYQYNQSIRVNSGMWVVFEHANFRGRQLLFDNTEKINWIKFNGWTSVGSIRPINQSQVYFRIKSRAKGMFLTVDENLEDPRGSKLSVCLYNGKPTQMWFYCHGLIKSKLNNACIDVIGGQGKSGTKVALWTEHGNIHQKWNINRNGTISSHLDSKLLLDIKGSDYWDKSHLILNHAQPDQQTQFWDIQVL